MKIQRLVLGSMMVNCYVLGEKSVAVVDPGADANAIVGFLQKEGMTLDKILVTHGHFDHVGALSELKRMTGAKVFMHKDDICMLGDREKSLGFMVGETPDKCEVDAVLSGGEEIEVEDEKLRVMHTPGHSMGSVSYIGDGFVCSGDLIFRESVGRYDFGDYNTEMESIDRLLDELGEECAILPGHGEATTVMWEMINNPYLRQL